MYTVKELTLAFVHLQSNYQMNPQIHQFGSIAKHMILVKGKSYHLPAPHMWLPANGNV